MSIEGRKARVWACLRIVESEEQPAQKIASWSLIFSFDTPNIPNYLTVFWTVA